MTTPDQILAAVEQVTGESPGDINSHRRTRGIAYARFLAMLLYSESRPMHSNQEVAAFVGKADPSTGRHGLMRARYLLANDQSFQQAHQSAKALLTTP